jgi:hypothetical protein
MTNIICELYHMPTEPVMRVNKYGAEEWLVNGQPHRTDGPAYIAKDGYQAWWVNGKRHRTDGPAVIWHDGDHEWFINGVDVTKEAKQWIRKQKISWPFDQETQTQFLLTFG